MDDLKQSALRIFRETLAAIDIPNLLWQTGDTLEEKTQADGVLTFRIRKK